MALAQKDKRKNMRMRWDLSKQIDKLIYERLEYLKTIKEFTETLRNALRLYFSLQDGDRSVLDELFPGVVADNSQVVEEFRAMLSQFATTKPVIIPKPAQMAEIKVSEHEASDDEIFNNFMNSF